VSYDSHPYLAILHLGTSKKSARNVPKQRARTKVGDVFSSADGHCGSLRAEEDVTKLLWMGNGE